MDARIDWVAGVLLAALAAVGCGGSEGTQDVVQADVVGAWSYKAATPTTSRASCAYAATFAADGTYVAGLCPPIAFCPVIRRAAR